MNWSSQFTIDEGIDFDAPRSPVARHVAVPLNEGAIRIEFEGAEPVVIQPPVMLSPVERAVRRREIEALGDEYQATSEGILDALLLGLLPWERAVLATRSVGPFRLPPALRIPWRPSPIEVAELQAWNLIEVADEVTLNLLVLARVGTASVQIHALVAPSGAVERAERRELEQAIADGDRAFDEV